MVSPATEFVDAGVRGLDHYKNRLPAWRFTLRERLIPYLRWETPFIASIQDTCRTPTMDAYFAFTANLGTHTFFMIMLPVMFYCGQWRLARAMTHMLAAGVLFSGFIKDMLCLPRPLSPPLQRITRSRSAALEYGFPSTHSTNAMSVVWYALYALPEDSNSTTVVTRLLLYLYAASILAGRIYCGMHGFIDVICGSLLGIAIAAVQMQYGDIFDFWISSGSINNLLVSVLIVLALVRIHPEPADDCPCFDDSVAFSGVFIGIQLGALGLLNSKLQYATVSPSARFSMYELGLIKAALRIVLGVLVVFLWRAMMKPTLLRLLPPLFRIIESLGLALPRRFHLRASQYGKVPPLRKDDNVIPSVSEIPDMIMSLRSPRKRTISIGAQTQADAHEAIAYREWKRRGSSAGPPVVREKEDAALASAVDDEEQNPSSRRGRPPSNGTIAYSRNPVASRENAGDHLNKEMLMVPEDVDDGRDTLDSTGYHTTETSVGGNNATGEEHYYKLHVPRVRYDVEVVTKLIVYAGIAWLATEFNFVLFEMLGLAAPN